MKLSILSLAVASAGLLASASPAPVVVVVSNPDGSFLPKPVIPAPGLMIKSSRPCSGARLRQKASSMITSFRIALGFSAGDKHVKAVEQEFKILPFVGTPNVVQISPGINGKPGAGGAIRIVHNSPEHAHGFGAHRFHHKHNGERPSFLMRVHFALMSLGPWEGRAVAFVLGCGIGVLLRMAWVLVVLTIRGFRSPRSEEEHLYTVVDMDAEEIFVAPPTYTYPVEKAEDASPAPAEETK